MKQIFIKTILASFFLVNGAFISANAKDNIRFVIRNETDQMIYKYCGNFSYKFERNIAPSQEYSYLVKPAGLVWNPRALKYSCGFSTEIAPRMFDLSRTNSEILYIIHSYEQEKTDCTTTTEITSLYVDGKLIENRKRRHSDLCPSD